MSNKTNVLIIGLGALGQGIHKVLDAKRTNFKGYDKDSKKNKSKESLTKLIGWADVIILAIPSWSLHGVCYELKPTLKKGAVVLFCSKGTLDDGTFVHEIAKHYFSPKQFAYIGGPMLADELRAGKGGAAVIASQSFSTTRKVSAVFSNQLILESSNDVFGTVLQGVLKNIYSIALGMAIYEKYGQNKKSIISVLSLREMLMIQDLLGVDEANILTFAGIPDFLATSSSTVSAHVRLGYAIANGEKNIQVIEGVHSLAGLKSRYPGLFKELPMLAGIYQVVYKKQKAAVFLNNLLK